MGNFAWNTLKLCNTLMASCHLWTFLSKYPETTLPLFFDGAVNHTQARGRLKQPWLRVSSSTERADGIWRADLVRNESWQRAPKRGPLISTPYSFQSFKNLSFFLVVCRQRQHQFRWRWGYAGVSATFRPSYAAVTSCFELRVCDFGGKSD